MLSILESASNSWIIVITAIGLTARQIVKLIMFKSAIRNTTPAERATIIHALRGLIGPRSPSRPGDRPDDKE
jgi:hypothetical protein